MMNSSVKLILLSILFTACTTEEGEIDDIEPNNTIPASCRLTFIESVKDNNVKSNQTFEYDIKNRLIKTAYSNTTITYEYDQNDFLLSRTTLYTPTYSVVDKYSYQNDKLILIETDQTIGSELTRTKTEYEYDNSGNLFKISKSDNKNNFTISNYKNNILVGQTSNKEDYEVNSLGLISKTTATKSEGVLIAGVYTLYTYDNNGQLLKTENFDKNGVLVNVRVFEYTTIKNILLTTNNYEANKGFPTIGKSFTKYLVKKDVTSLLNKNANKFEEYISFTYENHQVDKNGLLLSLSSRVVEGGVKVTSLSNTTYTYTGCD